MVKLDHAHRRGAPRAATVVAPAATRERRPPSSAPEPAGWRPAGRRLSPSIPRSLQHSPSGRSRGRPELELRPDRARASAPAMSSPGRHGHVSVPAPSPLSTIGVLSCTSPLSSFVTLPPPSGRTPSGAPTATGEPARPARSGAGAGRTRTRAGPPLRARLWRCFGEVAEAGPPDPPPVSAGPPTRQGRAGPGVGPPGQDRGVAAGPPRPAARPASRRSARRPRGTPPRR